MLTQNQPLRSSESQFCQGLSRALQLECLCLGLRGYQRRALVRCCDLVTDVKAANFPRVHITRYPRLLVKLAKAFRVGGLGCLWVGGSERLIETRFDMWLSSNGDTYDMDTMDTLIEAFQKFFSRATPPIS